MPKNQFGQPLDRNGYSASLLFGHGPNQCYLCRQYGHAERHEVFGSANRQKSKELGLWVHLCEECHRTGERAVHRVGTVSRSLKREAQMAAQSFYGWTADKFREQFGKSYL
jgi:hypothetical protein